MGRRAIIHIGMPRTGSTTFQHVLAHARGGLEEAGILYPDLTPHSARATPHLSHQHFGETLDGRRPRRERTELLQSLSESLSRTECDTVLISYEDFIQQKQRFAVPALLNEFFASHGFTAEALVVAKPQSEHLNSMYTLRTQLIRERHGFTYFARSHIGSGRFAYDRLIEPWLAAFGGRVRAVPVQDRRSPAAPLVMRMLSELNLYRRAVPAIGWSGMRRVENRSPGPVAVEVSRRLRMARSHAHLRVPPREMMRAVQRHANQLGYDGERFNGIGPELRDELAERYRVVNDRFARRLWGASWDDIVAPEPPRPVNELILGQIDGETETAILRILDTASHRFSVKACASAWDTPLNLLAEGFESLQRRLGISRWRVV